MKHLLAAALLLPALLLAAAPATAQDGKPATAPTSQPASQPASQPTSQPAPAKDKKKEGDLSKEEKEQLEALGYVEE